MLSAGDQALVDVISSMSLSADQLACLAQKPGWEHLGLSRGSSHPHLFITLLLPRTEDGENRSPESLHRLVSNVTPRIATLVGATCVLEFTDAKGGFHPHCHILADKPPGFRKSNLIRSLVRACGLARPECVNILMSNKAIDYCNRLAYVHGKKADSSKTSSVLKDVEIRDAAQIPHFWNL